MSQGKRPSGIGKKHPSVPDAGITLECSRNRKEAGVSGSSWEVGEHLELKSEV